MNVKIAATVFLYFVAVCNGLFAVDYDDYLDGMMEKAKKGNIYSMSILGDYIPVYGEIDNEAKIFFANIKFFIQLIALKQSLTSEDEAETFEKTFRGIGNAVKILRNLSRGNIVKTFEWYTPISHSEWPIIAGVVSAITCDSSSVEKEYKAQVKNDTDKISQTIDKLRTTIENNELYKSKDKDLEISPAIDIFKIVNQQSTTAAKIEKDFI
ncbi:MAG: hypothetical protein LBD17_03335 [Endomicrobium sp.]|jgi:hypothetical protein|nr:hypothetical protein [Endomicrobium sp.]